MNLLVILLLLCTSSCISFTPSISYDISHLNNEYIILNKLEMYAEGKSIQIDADFEIKQDIDISEKIDLKINYIINKRYILCEFIESNDILKCPLLAGNYTVSKNTDTSSLPSFLKKYYISAKILNLMDISVVYNT